VTAWCDASLWQCGAGGVRGDVVWCRSTARKCMRRPRRRGARRRPRRREAGVVHPPPWELLAASAGCPSPCRSDTKHDGPAELPGRPSTTKRAVLGLAVRPAGLTQPVTKSQRACLVSGRAKSG
jgi:hypothetical protein